VFFLYCAVSVLWSDYPDVALKRWIKGLGDLAMILIVLTDQNPSAAFRRLLARVGFLLLPLSVLFNKYYPAIGMSSGRWGNTGWYTGVATSKNELGGVCLLFGIGSLWRFCEALRDGDDPHRLRRLMAHGALLAMVVWLFSKSHTATALSCFVMASSLIAVTSIRARARKPWVVHVMVAGMLSVSFAALFLDVGANLVETMGRDPTLTGRTGLWKDVLAITPNTLFGVGFESFWLPNRTNHLWNMYWWHPNEAHNGYIEVLITLGWTGIALLAVVIVTGYRKVIGAVRRKPEENGLWLAYFFIGLVYNFTESAVRIMHPVWIFFLLATTAASIASVSDAAHPLDIEHTEDFAGWAGPVRAPDIGASQENI